MIRDVLDGDEPVEDSPPTAVSRRNYRLRENARTRETPVHPSDRKTRRVERFSG